MKLIYPEYYEAFHCIAGACPDSCCKEWDVEVDSDSAARYRSMQGPLGEVLRQHLYEEDGNTYLAFPEGRCPLLREDRLCRLQAELGEQALCAVCRKFPRLTQDYGEFVELGLEMSCPEAARILMTGEGTELVEQEVDGGEPGDYDHEVMDVLRRARPKMMALLKDQRFAVNERLALALLYGYQVQNEVDGGEEAPFDPESGLQTIRQTAGAGDSRAIADFFAGLEILTDRWRERLEHPRQEPCWFEGLSRFACYGMYRYFYQAVSDYDLVGRVKLVITGCILTALLADETPESQIDTIHLYSKEIENDADNVDAILEGAYSHPALTDRSLLGVLLGKK